MMINQKKNTVDISILYSLSLALGNSLNLRENCEAFINVFTKIKGLTFAAIWVKSSGDGSYELINSTESYERNVLIGSEIHKEYLNYEIINSESTIFSIIRHKDTIVKGTYGIIRLGEIGILKCYSKDIIPFSIEDWQALQPIFDRLRDSLASCQKHQILTAAFNGLKEESKGLFARDKLYNIAVQNFSEGMILTDVDDKITFVNNKMCELSGYEVDELIGRVSHQVFLEKGEWENAIANLQKTNKKELRGNQERKLAHKNGTIWWGIVNRSPLINKKEEFKGLLITIADITSKKNAEIEKELLLKAFVENENKYRLVVQNLSEGVVMTDTFDRILYVNQQMCHLTGYSEAEMLGNKAYELLLPKNEWPSSEEKLTERSEGIAENYVKRHVRKNGTIWWGNINASPLIDDNGNFTGTLAAVMDVTEKIEAERLREQLMEELAEKNKDLDDFAYIVSHDLKAPLRGIKTLSDWIYQDYSDALGEDGKEQLLLLQKRVVRMRNFIESLLEYARIGRMQLKEEQFDLQESILKIIDSLQPLENCDIKIRTTLPVIFAKKLRIEQVFQNLISNAIKYNDKPQGLIEISHEESDNFYTFKVKDNGMGIDEKYFDKIFQIFQTLEARDTYESTGIGLSIVKKIIETHKGKIKVKSELGKGSAFIFTVKK